MQRGISAHAARQQAAGGCEGWGAVLGASVMYTEGREAPWCVLYIKERVSPGTPLRNMLVSSDAAAHALKGGTCHVSHRKRRPAEHAG